MQIFHAERRIGLHHVAFFRAFFEDNLELAAIADRYLETGKDIPAARRTLKMVQEALIAEAWRQGRRGDARLLRLPHKAIRGPSALQDAFAPAAPAPAADVPSFEDFADEFDPDRILSEQELLDRYNDEYGTINPAFQVQAPQDALTPAQSRRMEREAALFARRIRVINDLSDAVSKMPRAEDTVEGWFDPRVAARLHRAGLKTLADIVAYANYQGYRWHRHIPKFGAVTAAKITNWLHVNAHSLGVRLSDYALKPRREKPAQRDDARQVVSTVPEGSGSGSIVESWDLLSDTADTVAHIAPGHGLHDWRALDGSMGRNRGPESGNRLEVNNDLAAIQAFLKIKRNVHTRRSYAKEADRFLLWAIVEKQKPLSSLTTEDVSDYQVFLEDPQPRHRWVAPKRLPRDHPAWRPFLADSEQDGAGGLTRESIKLATTILSAMCEWLTKRGYLASNPWDGLSAYIANQGLNTGRSLTERQWKLCTEFLQRQDANDPKVARLRFVMKLAYATGLRLSEMVNATTGALSAFELDDGQAWTLTVQGKRSKVREVPVPSPVMRELQAYLQQRGLVFQKIRDLPASTPLIAALHNPSSPISASSLSKFVVGFFKQVAQSLVDQPETAERLKQASTHWMRHTFGSHAVVRSSVVTVQKLMGHSSVHTTSLYLRTERDKTHREMEEFMQASDF